MIALPNDVLSVHQDRVGETVQHRYRLDKLLGVGGFGAVFRATHIHMGTAVAIKILHAEHCRDARTVKRFELEAKRSAALKHPNTIRVFDFGPTEAGEFFIAMEYLEGRSLAAVLNDGEDMPPERVVHILSQVLRSLDEAHLAGLVHRDLKPDNIYLLEIAHECDFVKVLDFGIAKAPRQDSVMTTAGTMIGTPVYMSPEQCRGREIDGRSDLYSLGCIAFEMLTGRPPFHSSDPLGYAVAHVNEPPPDVRRMRGLDHPIPEALARWVMRLLEKDPDARYPDALTALDALSAAFTAAASSQPTGAVGTGAPGGVESMPTPRLPRGAPAPLGTERARLESGEVGHRRGRRAWLWGGLAGLAIVGGLALVLAWPRPSEPTGPAGRDEADLVTAVGVEDAAAGVAPREVVGARAVEPDVYTAAAGDVAAETTSEPVPEDASAAHAEDAVTVVRGEDAVEEIAVASDGGPIELVAEPSPRAVVTRSVALECAPRATVYVNQEARGTTPVTLTWAEGAAPPTVRLVAPGYRAATVTLTEDDARRGVRAVKLQKIATTPRATAPPPDNIPTW